MKQGFTLIELIMVIIVVGILVTLAVPQYNRTAERARASEAVNLLGALRHSQIRYRSEWGLYTSTMSNLDMDYTSIKFFNSPPTSAGTAANLATLSRNTGVAWPGGTGYNLTINEAGTIGCTNNLTACGLIGY